VHPLKIGSAKTCATKDRLDIDSLNLRLKLNIFALEAYIGKRPNLRTEYRVLDLVESFILLVEKVKASLHRSKSTCLYKIEEASYHLGGKIHKWCDEPP
jgi:hypothetical protein